MKKEKVGDQSRTTVKPIQHLEWSEGPPGIMEAEVSKLSRVVNRMETELLDLKQLVTCVKTEVLNLKDVLNAQHKKSKPNPKVPTLESERHSPQYSETPYELFYTQASPPDPEVNSETLTTHRRKKSGPASFNSSQEFSQSLTMDSTMNERPALPSNPQNVSQSHALERTIYENPASTASSLVLPHSQNTKRRPTIMGRKRYAQNF